MRHKNCVCRLLVGVSFVFFFTGLGGAVSPVATAKEDKITLEALIAKHIEALGGADRIQKTTTRVANGKAQLTPGRNSNLKPMTGKATFSSKLPNKVYTYFDFNGQIIARGFNGSQPWLRPMPPANESILIKNLKGLLSNGCMLHDISVFDFLQTPGKTEIKLKGTKKINDREAYQVEIKGQDFSAKVFIDALTFLRVKTQLSFVFDPGGSGVGIGAIPGSGTSSGTYSGTGTSGGFGGGALTTVTVEFETGDFRDVNGIKLPFSYKEVLPSHTIQVVIDNYEENTLLGDSIFQ